MELWDDEAWLALAVAPGRAGARDRRARCCCRSRSTYLAEHPRARRRPVRGGGADRRRPRRSTEATGRHRCRTSRCCSRPGAGRTRRPPELIEAMVARRAAPGRGRGARRRRVRERGPLQRPRPLRAAARGRAAGRPTPDELGRSRRGRCPSWSRRRRGAATPTVARDGARAAVGAHARQRHRLGARDRGARRARCSSDGEAADELLPRGDRAPRPHPAARAARPRPAALRRVAAPRGPARRRPRAAARRARGVRRDGRRGVRRARPARAARPPARRCASARDDTRDELTPQEEQIARLARDGLTNPEIGAAAVPQPAHRRVAPAQGVHQARHQLAQGAARRAGAGGREAAPA